VTDIFFAGERSGSPDSRMAFKALSACCTALKSAGESMRMASLNTVRGFGGVEGQVCYGGSDDVTRRRTFVGKNG